MNRGSGQTTDEAADDLGTSPRGDSTAERA